MAPLWTTVISTSIGLAVVIAVLFAIAMARLRAGEDRVSDFGRQVNDWMKRLQEVETEVPAAKHVELIAAMDTLRAAWEQHGQVYGEFKDYCYRQIQRTDAIMRRNEKAVTALGEAEEQEPGDELPDEVPLQAAGATPALGGDMTPPDGLSKQERLRWMYNKRRGLPV